MEIIIRKKQEEKGKIVMVALCGSSAVVTE